MQLIIVIQSDFKYVTSSTFCIRFLQNLDTLCNVTNIPGGIIWCYNRQSAVPRQQLAALRKKVQIHDGVIENIENAQGKPCLLYS